MMMGQQSADQERLFYAFDLEDHVPCDHLLRGIVRFLDLSDLRRPTEGDAITADYASFGLSLRAHPLALLRPRLEQMAFVTAERVLCLAHGDTVRAAGLVITRQRPGTATGVVFVTLEDETGYLNLVVCSSLVDSQRKELLGSRLFAVPPYGALCLALWPARGPSAMR